MTFLPSNNNSHDNNYIQVNAIYSRIVCDNKYFLTGMFINFTDIVILILEFEILTNSRKKKIKIIVLMQPLVVIKMETRSKSILISIQKVIQYKALN